MELDWKRIEDATLALLFLGLHDGVRIWKGFDWDVLDRFHEEGYISEPRGKARSMAFTPEGFERSKRLLEELFAGCETREEWLSRAPTLGEDDAPARTGVIQSASDGQDRYPAEPEVASVQRVFKARNPGRTPPH